MTDTEMIANVVIAAVKAATAPMLERIAVLEARAPIPGPAGEPGMRGADGGRGDRGEHGEKGLDGKDGKDGAVGPSVNLDELAFITKRQIDAAFRDRPEPKDGVSVANVFIDDTGQLCVTLTDGTTKDVGNVVGAKGQDGRDGLPGIGRPGLDGKDGQNGLDGLGFDDIEHSFDGERTVEFIFKRGGQVKKLGAIRFPVVIYRGVYTPGRTYEQGDAATWGGSQWIARDTTTSKPGDGATAWQLAVKSGRDGKDGKLGGQGGPGPKGDKGDPGRNFS